MNQSECNELRDLLFATHFLTGDDEGVFRYLAVLPGGEGDAEATVHYAYVPGLWTRAGWRSTDMQAFLPGLIAMTRFSGKRIHLQFQDYMFGGWPLPWNLTARAANNAFPTLVLLELPSGAVTGVLMRDPRTDERTARELANDAAELEEAARLLETLRNLAPDEKYLSWYKDVDIAGVNVQAAIEDSPKSDDGQVAILLYRDNEWLFDIWDDSRRPAGEGLILSIDLEWMSLADFYGTRVSAAKRATRDGMELVRHHQTIAGDAAVLEEALELFQPIAKNIYSRDYESTPAVKKLCDWWNTHAPENMRHAGYFRVYIWGERDKIFTPGDPEEPAVRADQLVESGVYAVFDIGGLPPVVLQFHRGQAYNVVSRTGGTQTFLANGEECMDIGLAPEEVNEAYAALRGLQRIHC